MKKERTDGVDSALRIKSLLNKKYKGEPKAKFEYRVGKLSPPPLDSRSGPLCRDIDTNNFCLKSNINQ